MFHRLGFDSLTALSNEHDGDYKRCVEISKASAHVLAGLGVLWEAPRKPFRNLAWRSAGSGQCCPLRLRLIDGGPHDLKFTSEQLELVYRPPRSPQSPAARRPSG